MNSNVFTKKEFGTITSISGSYTSRAFTRYDANMTPYYDAEGLCIEGANLTNPVGYVSYSGKQELIQRRKILTYTCNRSGSTASYTYDGIYSITSSDNFVKSIINTTTTYQKHVASTTKETSAIKTRPEVFINSTTTSMTHNVNL